MATDVRHAYHLIWRSPRLFLLLGLVLGASIGTATATFGVADALLRPPLPFSDPDGLTVVWTARSGQEKMMVSVQELNLWKARSRCFQYLAMEVGWMFSIGSAGLPTQAIVGVHVSGDFFQLLGVQPLLGRVLTDSDDRIGADRVAVLAESIWRTRFGADPGVIGRRIELDSLPYTIVGIVGDEFRFSYPGNEPVYVWTPLAVSFPYYSSQLVAPLQRDKHALGRLAPGATLADAQRELSSISMDGGLSGPFGGGNEPKLVPLLQEVVDAPRDHLLLACSAAALLMVVVMCNVASLLLSRVQSRRAELALRVALGATRGRVMQQLATEVVLLFVLAAPLAAVIAEALLAIFYQLVLEPSAGSRANGIYEVAPALAWLQVGRIHLNGSALLFGVSVTLGGGLVSAIVPAIDGSHGAIRGALERAGARAPTTGSTLAFRAVMIATQVALTFTLLVGSGSALLALSQLSRTSLGFDPNGLLAFRLLGSAKHYADLRQLEQLYAKLMQQLLALPDVRAVAISPLTSAPAAPPALRASRRCDAPPVTVLVVGGDLYVTLPFAGCPAFAAEIRSVEAFFEQELLEALVAPRNLLPAEGVAAPGAIVGGGRTPHEVAHLLNFVQHPGDAIVDDFEHRSPGERVAPEPRI